MSDDSVTKQVSCKDCAFCKWQEMDGKRFQVGCRTGQLDNYKKLKQRVDPNGDDIENPVFKYKDEGGQKFYVVKPACAFTRSVRWTDEHCPDYEKLSLEALRAIVFETVPFLYLLTVAYGGDTKRTLRSVRSALNSTVKPQIMEIISPYDLAGEARNLTAMTLEIKKMRQENKEYENIAYNVRQMSQQGDYSKMIETAIQNHTGFFYVLSLEEGVKVSPDFMESIKHQVLDHFLDFHIISLENQYKSALWAGPLFFGSEFSKLHAFIQDGKNIVQRFDQNYVKNFFPEVV